MNAEKDMMVKSTMPPPLSVTTSPSSGAVSSNATSTFAWSAKSDSTPENGFISSTAATNNGDTGRKFIKTAAMKFRVKNVYTSTYKIEDIIKNYGGFVSSTNLNSSIENRTVTSVSEDSSLESTYYVVSNYFTVRVPSNKLDTTLRTIAKLIDYLDYREIKADDVRFDLLLNQYTQLRAQRHARRVTNDINAEGRKLKETTDAEESVTNHEEEADNAHLENLKLADQIKFSTVNIEIYQRETIKRVLIANEKNIRAYEPGFGFKLLDALKGGWSILETIMVALANIWFIYLFAIVVYVLYRLFRKPGKQ